MFLRSLYPRLTAIAFLLSFSSDNLFALGRVRSTIEHVKATFRFDVIEEFFTQESALFSNAKDYRRDKRDLRKAYKLSKSFESFTTSYWKNFSFKSYLCLGQQSQTLPSSFRLSFDRIVNFPFTVFQSQSQPRVNLKFMILLTQYKHRTRGSRMGWTRRG